MLPETESKPKSNENRTTLNFWNRSRTKRELNQIIFAEFVKDGSNYALVTSQKVNSKTLIHVRIFRKTARGNYLPSKIGIAFAPDELPRLIEGLQQAQRECEKPI